MTYSEPVATAAGTDVAALFRQHHASLIRLAVLLLRDRPAAEDVVQDAFAALHARKEPLGPGDNPLAYVRASVVNGCRRVLRRRALAGRLGSTPGPHPAWPGRSAEQEVIWSEERRRVLAALAGLPRRRQEVLVLRYYLGLSEAEIAQVLKIRPGTVKSTAARGLAALGQALGNET